MAYIQHVHKHNSGRVAVLTELYFDSLSTVALTPGFWETRIGSINKIDEIGSEIPKSRFRLSKTDVRGPPEENYFFLVLLCNHMARPNTVSSNERGLTRWGWRLLSIIAIEFLQIVLALHYCFRWMVLPQCALSSLFLQPGCGYTYANHPMHSQNLSNSRRWGCTLALTTHPRNLLYF